MLQSLAVKVSTAGAAVPSSVSELATSSSTSPVGSLSSRTVNVAVPPDSVVTSRLVADVAGDTATPAVSSSARVSDAPVTIPTPWPFAALPVTVTALSAASTALSTPDTVAVSEAFAVAPAAITMVASEPTLYAAPIAAVTVTVVGSDDGRDSSAVTVAAPPFSETEDGVTDNATVGAASSSVSIRVAPVTAPAPWPLASAAVTVGVRAGSSTSLSTATTVAVSVAFVVEPAAITMVASEPTV